jgi:tetratricopeptide (TPR) repeat protein
MPFTIVGPLSEGALAFDLAQEIAAALARFRWFDVVSPLSFGRPSDVAPDGHALHDKGLDYVVDGALSERSGHLQISVRLFEVSGLARPVWSERFDAGLDDLDRLDELVTSRIVARIDPVILFTEAGRPHHETSEPTSLLLRALPMLHSMERAVYEEAGQILETVVRLEPENAMAAAWAAYWQVYHVGQGWSRDIASALGRAQELSIRAIRLDPDNAEALAIYGHVQSFLHRDFDAALHYFDRALRLNPNLAFAWALSAATFCYIGEPDTALARLERYRELAPFEPYFCFYENIYTIAHTFRGDYDEAVRVGRRAVRANPEFVNGYKPLIASLGHLRRIDEAKAYLRLLERREPGFSIERFVGSYPFRRAADRERYVEGLRLAGVSERKPRLSADSSPGGWPRLAGERG